MHIDATPPRRARSSPRCSRSPGLGRRSPMPTAPASLRRRATSSSSRFLSTSPVWRRAKPDGAEALAAKSGVWPSRPFASPPSWHSSTAGSTMPSSKPCSASPPRSASRQTSSHDIADVAQGHLRDATAHMIRANLESLTGQALDDRRRRHGMVPALQGHQADPTLAARFHALGELPRRERSGTPSRHSTQPTNTHSRASEQALNFNFAAPHELVAHPGRLRHHAARRTAGINLHGRACTARHAMSGTCCR